MGLPAGTKYYVPVTVDKTKIGESVSNFLYQCDLSAKLAADAVFKSHIATEANIAVYSVATGLKVPRRIVLDLATNTLIIYWDGATSTVSNPVFYICVGSAINEVNSTSAFTNSGVTSYLGFDEPSGATSTIDYATSTSGSVVANTTLGNSGIFYKSATFDNAVGRVLFSSNLIPSGNMSIDVLLKWGGYGENSAAPIIATEQFTLAGLGDNTVYVKNNAGATLNRSQQLISLGTNQHLTITRNGQNITYYSAGVTKGTTDGGTISNGMGTSIGNEHNALMRATFNGSISDIMISNDIKSQDIITTRSNMLMNPATFWSIGSGKQAGLPVILWNKVKQRLRAGFK